MTLTTNRCKRKTGFWAARFLVVSAISVAWLALVVLVALVWDPDSASAQYSKQYSKSAVTVQFECSNYTVLENVGTLTVTVTLSAPSEHFVKVTVTTCDGTGSDKATAPTDYQWTVNQLLFFPGETSQQFSVEIVNDGIPELTETFNLTLSDPEFATLGTPSTATVTIVDDDTSPPTVQFECANYYVGEIDCEAWIIVTLSYPSTQTVQVTCKTVDGGTATKYLDYTPNSEVLLFVPGETRKEFKVLIHPDGETECEETVLIELCNLVNIQPGSQLSSTLTIQDSSVLPVASLGIDTNMDGKITNADHDIRQDPKAIIINVNNTDADKDGKPDNQDNMINGAVDKKGLTELLLRQIKNFPKGGKATLTVSDKNKMRIFNDEDQGVIGPPAADGGPDQDSYEVPAAKITKGNVTFLVECFNHGNETITLTVNDAAGKEVTKDFVRVVLNVDRGPGNKVVPLRFRVGVIKPKDNLDGIEAKIVTPKTKVNYAPNEGPRKIRMQGLSAVFAGVTKDDGSLWMQTGLTCYRLVGKSPEYYIYCEVKYKTGRLFDKKKTGGTFDDWPAGNTKYKVAVTDANTGKVEGFLNDNSWTQPFSKDEFKKDKMNLWSIGSELAQSVDQNAGKVGNECIISEAKIAVSGNLQATDIGKDDVTITDFDKNGDVVLRETSHEWAFSDVIATGFKMWDKLVEH